MKMLPQAVTAGGPGNYENFLAYDLELHNEQDAKFAEALRSSLPERVHGQMEIGKVYLCPTDNSSVRLAFRVR
jgi:hypothetical protein